MNKSIFTVLLFSLLSLSFIAVSCGGDASEDNARRDKSIREANLDEEAEVSGVQRMPCDTISLQEHVITSYPPGTYLVQNEQTTTFNIQSPAVIYQNIDGNTYIFAVIAKSKEGERYVEVKNIVGYEASFKNLDSTKLGTAFFYLTLFECDGNGMFTQIWEKQVPIHTGFNKITLETWKPKGMKYIKLNYNDGIISGFRNYNFFFVDGMLKPPHLMETYEGIARKRTMANVNNDKYPDFYEFRYFEDDTALVIKEVDSLAFYWDEKKELYITNRSSRWFRPY